MRVMLTHPASGGSQHSVSGLTPMRRKLRRIIALRLEKSTLRTLLRTLLSLALLSAGVAHAAGGPLGIDHPIKFDQSGIWSRNTQVLLEAATLFTVVGGAMWGGGETRLGKTYWRAIDSTIMATAAAEVGKYRFQRARPTQTSDPNQ